MSEDFDPYYVWLGIPPAEQPPNLYRLLGIPLFESQPEVIQNAADQRMLHVRTFQSGPRGAISQQLLNEIVAANRVLMDPHRKQDYDATLSQHAAAIPLAPPASPPPAQPPPAQPPTSPPAPMAAPAYEQTQQEAHQQWQNPAPTVQPANQSAPIQSPNQPAKPAQFESATISQRRSHAKPTPSQRQTSCMIPVAIVGGILGLITALALVWVLTGKNALVEIGFIDGAKPDKQPPALKQAPDSKIGSSNKNRSSKRNTKRNSNGTNKRATPPPSQGDSTKDNSNNMASNTKAETKVVSESARDLLALIVPQRHAAQGTITIEPQGLSLINSSGRSHVVLPITPATNYDLTGKVIRTDQASAGLIFGLLIDDQLFDLTIDDQERTGVELIDGRSLAQHRFAVSGRLLPPVTRVAIRISVRSNGVALFLNEKRVYQWAGEPRRLSRSRTPSKTNRGFMNLQVTDGTFLVEELEYVAFSDGASPLNAASSTKPISGSLPIATARTEAQSRTEAQARPEMVKRNESGAIVKVEPAPVEQENSNATNPFEVDPDGKADSENPFDRERVFSDKEQGTLDAIGKSTKLIMRELHQNGSANVSSMLAELKELDSFPEAKQKIEGITKIVDQHSLFRQSVIKACGKLEKGDELEVGDRLMRVVQASEEEIVLSYSNSTATKSPAELPTNVALEVLLHSRPLEPTAESLLMDGAAHAIDGGEDNLKMARKKWGQASELGADVDELLLAIEGM